jgi:hypothetical protein
MGHDDADGWMRGGMRWPNYGVGVTRRRSFVNRSQGGMFLHAAGDDTG